MSTEPEPKPRSTAKRLTKRIPVAGWSDEGFVVFEVDGYAQLTPEQKTWPVVDIFAPRPHDPPPPPGDAPEPPG